MCTLAKSSINVSKCLVSLTFFSSTQFVIDNFHIYWDIGRWNLNKRYHFIQFNPTANVLLMYIILIWTKQIQSNMLLIFVSIFPCTLVYVRANMFCAYFEHLVTPVKLQGNFRYCEQNTEQKKFNAGTHNHCKWKKGAFSPNVHKMVRQRWREMRKKT